MAHLCVIDEIYPYILKMLEDIVAKYNPLEQFKST